MKPFRPVRVLFLLQRPEAWVNLSSLWRAMRRDGNFSPVVWVLPYNFENKAVSSKKAPLMREMLKLEAVPFREWDESCSLLNDHFDVAVFNHPYDRERPEVLWFDRVSAVVPVTLYIPYGLVMGGGRKNLRLQFSQPPQIRATVVLARSQYETNLYQKHCPSGAGHVHVLGLPRFDHLLTALSEPVPSTLKDVVGDRLVVLWNSHFSFGKSYSQSSNFSTFDMVGPELFELVISRRESVCLLWRPHPGLFSAIVREGLLSEGELSALRSELADIGVVLDETTDHAAAFAASHAMLTDVGSFLLEYLVTGKPILALINPEGEPFNDESLQLVKHYACASVPAEVEQFIDLLETGEAAIFDLQRAQANHLPMLDGRAGERVAQLILNLCRGESTFLGSVSPAKLCLPVCGNDRGHSMRLAKGAVSQLRVPPTLGRLIRGLRVLREEKAREPVWRKIVRRRINEIRTIIGEAIKMHPTLMQGVRFMRGLRER